MRSTPARTDREIHSKAYFGREWDRVRARHIANHATCECTAAELYEGCECVGACGRLARIVDHYVPSGVAVLECRDARGADGRKIWPFNPNAGFYLQCNLRSLCDRCHGNKTANDKRHTGPWPSVVAGWLRLKGEQEANKPLDSTT